MKNMTSIARSTLWLRVLFALVLASCTQQTKDNFQDPPFGPPTSCTMNASVSGCSGGSLGYTCDGGRPDEKDTSLVCSDGMPSAAGATIYCCAPYGQYYSDCAVDASIPGCVGDAFGFRCAALTSPSEADQFLACNTGKKSGDDMLYCCNSVTLPPTCAADAAVEGCAGVAIGYSCVGTDSPNKTNASLACSVPKRAASGATESCCLPFPIAAGCDEDDAVTGCGPGSYGFSCTGDVTPDKLNETLRCHGAGAGQFCCEVE